MITIYPLGNPYLLYISSSNSLALYPLTPVATALLTTLTVIDKLVADFLTIKPEYPAPTKALSKNWWISALKTPSATNYLLLDST